MWKIENGRLTHADLPQPIESFFVKPYTIGVWFAEGGRLKQNRLPEAVKSGAFINCSQLAQVEIPESVKRIGTHTFAGTKLKKVKIAKDCIYSESSFPDDCEIEFY